MAVALPNIPEYAIAVLGAIEAGLTVTTINPLYTAGALHRNNLHVLVGNLFQNKFTDEISRQLVMSSPKMIIGTVEGMETLTTAKSIAQLSIPILAIKTDKHQTIPDGIINFSEISDPKSE